MKHAMAIINGNTYTMNIEIEPDFLDSWLCAIWH